MPKKTPAPASDVDPAEQEAARARAAQEREATARLDALVGDWLSYPEVAEMIGVSLSAVRGLVADRELVAVRRGPNRALAVPAVLVTPEGPRPEMRGTFTVLADGGMTDLELLTWLFTPDETLPLPGSPMDNIVGGRKTEVRRRAMETAF